MTDINNVVLIGRLTRDAELKYSSGGLAIGRFSIANNYRKPSGNGNWEDEVNYFDIVLFGKSAESLNQYLVKGQQICVSGELRQNRWEQDGQARNKIEIIANNIELLGSKSQSFNQNQGSNYQQNYGAPQGAPYQQGPNQNYSNQNYGNQNYGNQGSAYQNRKPMNDRSYEYDDSDLETIPF